MSLTSFVTILYPSHVSSQETLLTLQTLVNLSSVTVDVPASSLLLAAAVQPALIPIGFAHAEGWFGIHSVSGSTSMAQVLSQVPPTTRDAEQRIAGGIARGTIRVGGPRAAYIDDLAAQMTLYSLPPEQFIRLVCKCNGPGIMFCFGVEVFPGGDGVSDGIFGRVGRSFLDGMSACAEEVTRRWREAPLPLAVPQRVQLPEQLNPFSMPRAAQPGAAVSVPRAAQPEAALEPAITGCVNQVSRRQRRRRSSASARRASGSMAADATSAFTPTVMVDDDLEEPVRSAPPTVAAAAPIPFFFMGTTCTSFSAPLTPECAELSKILSQHVRGRLSLYVMVRLHHSHFVLVTYPGRTTPPHLLPGHFRRRQKRSRTDGGTLRVSPTS